MEYIHISFHRPTLTDSNIPLSLSTGGTDGVLVLTGLKADGIPWPGVATASMPHMAETLR